MLLFDMDGTLIDSNGMWKDVDTEFLARRGLPYTQAYYEGVAHTIFPLAAKFTKEFCHLPESEEEIMAEWMELAGDLYAGSVPEKPGVRAFLERMRARGERMAVVTSAVPVHCRSALTHLGLLPYFERIFFAQELGMEKKTPELWCIAAITGGAIGNFIDRISTGLVIDMICIPWFSTFNVADLFITFGALILVVYILTKDKELLADKPKEQKKPHDADA